MTRVTCYIPTRLLRPDSRSRFPCQTTLGSSAIRPNVRTAFIADLRITKSFILGPSGKKYVVPWIKDEIYTRTQSVIANVPEFGDANAITERFPHISLENGLTLYGQAGFKRPYSPNQVIVSHTPPYSYKPIRCTLWHTPQQA